VIRTYNLLIPTATPVSPLRQRLIDDMNMRRFSRETQRNYIRSTQMQRSYLYLSLNTRDFPRVSPAMAATGTLCVTALTLGAARPCRANCAGKDLFTELMTTAPAELAAIKHVGRSLPFSKGRLFRLCRCHGARAAARGTAGGTVRRAPALAGGRQGVTISIGSCRAQRRRSSLALARAKLTLRRSADTMLFMVGTGTPVSRCSIWNWRRSSALAVSGEPPAETWTSGHRTPYGLAFGPDGTLHLSDPRVTAFSAKVTEAIAAAHNVAVEFIEHAKTSRHTAKHAAGDLARRRTRQGRTVRCPGRILT
jgi:hypothetical protein